MPLVVSDETLLEKKAQDGSLLGPQYRLMGLWAHQMKDKFYVRFIYQTDTKEELIERHNVSVGETSGKVFDLCAPVVGTVPNIRTHLKCTLYALCVWEKRPAVLTSHHNCQRAMDGDWLEAILLDNQTGILDADGNLPSITTPSGEKVKMVTGRQTKVVDLVSLSKLPSPEVL